MKNVTSKLFAFLMLLVVFTSLLTPSYAINPLEGLTGEDAEFVVAGQQKEDGTDIEKGLVIPGITDSKKPDTDQSNAWNTLFIEYRGIIIGCTGIGALTFLVFFIINFLKLGASAGNSQMRSQALMGLIWTGIACAGCGGIAIFVGFFYNLLQK